jgi:hypothetical protein
VEMKPFIGQRGDDGFRLACRMDVYGGRFCGPRHVRALWLFIRLIKKSPVFTDGDGAASWIIGVEGDSELIMSPFL